MASPGSSTPQTAPTTTQVLKFSNGQTVNFNSITDWAYVGNVITFNQATGSTIVYTAANIFSVLKQIHGFLVSGASFIFISDNGVASLSFLGITIVPTTPVHGTTFNFILNGTGFMNAVINQVKLQNGGGPVYINNVATMDDNNLFVNVAGTGIPAASGTYLVSYSSDNGVTWTTTGQSVGLS